MDPNACITLIANAMRAEDFDSAAEHLENLWDWFEGGGFEPDWTTEDGRYFRANENRLHIHIFANDEGPELGDLPEDGEMVHCYCGMTVLTGVRHYPGNDPEDGPAHLPRPFA
jgi:hypothetical protein